MKQLEKELGRLNDESDVERRLANKDQTNNKIEDLQRYISDLTWDRLVGFIGTFVIILCVYVGLSLFQALLFGDNSAPEAEGEEDGGGEVKDEA